jgi:predicted RNA binding protein YcfA (HicA-like mRNA interferase family)
MSPKTPRDVSGSDLIKVLSKYGYSVVRQTGSHIRLSRSTGDTVHNLTIPNHNPMKLGTLSAILNDASTQLKISKDELISKL